MRQAGLFGLSDQLKRLSDCGDPLETMSWVMAFEVFRPALENALAYGDGAEGGRPRAPPRSGPTSRPRPRRRILSSPRPVSVKLPGYGIHSEGRADSSSSAGTNRVALTPSDDGRGRDGNGSTRQGRGRPSSLGAEI